MWRVTWKGLLAHKLRLALTALSIVLGVAFVAGTFVLTDSLSASFEGLFADIAADTDVYVNPSAAFDPSFANSGPIAEAGTIPEDVLAAVLAVDGVAAAGGYVQGLAVMLDREGQALGGNGPPQFGFSASPDVAGSVTLREGRLSDGPDEVTIDVTSAANAGYALGDTVDIVTDGGRASYAIVGLTGFGEEDNLLGATIATFDLATARALFGKPGVYDQIAVQGAEGVTPDTLAERISAVLPESAEAVTAASEQEEQLAEVQTFLGVFNTALLAFGAIALFVGAFIIANTFSIVVTQRTREYALLRALGASARQVTRSVLLEAVMVGVVSSLAGLGLGIGLAGGLRALLGAFGLDFPDGATIIAPRTIITALTVGMTITVVSALLPARRAARVAPVEAMRGTGLASEGSSRVRTVAGVVLLVGGATALLVGRLGNIDNALSFVAGGAAFTMIGVSMLAPLIAGPVTGVLGTVVARRGITGRLARENARRNPKRTASTAAALMIGLALVSFVTILAASITASLNGLLDEQFRADYIISAGTAGPPAPMPAAIGDALAALPELGAVTGFRSGPVEIDGTQYTITGVDVEGLPDLIDLGITAGDVTVLAADGFFAAEELATAQGWAVGDTVDATFLAGGTTMLRLDGLYTSTELIGASVMLSDAGWRANFTTRGDLVVFADAAEGVDPAVALAAVEGVLADAPSVSVQDQASFRQEQDDAIGQILNLMLVLLALAVVIALIGITNTMALSVFERTREIGLLRAVGMTAKQVRQMVRGESALVALFGGVLGVTVGGFFGWSVVSALADDGLKVLTIPYSRLAIYLVVAGFAGVLAGSFPARRAARLDVLQAITTE